MLYTFFLSNIILTVDFLPFIIMFGKIVLEIFIKVTVDILLNIIKYDVISGTQNS